MNVDRSAPFLGVSVVNPGSDSEPIDIGMLVLSMSYEDSEKKADKATLKIDNFDLAAFDNLLFAPGNVLDITWGYSGLLSQTRTAVIKTMKGGAQLSIEAEAKSVLMHRAHVSRTFEGVKRSDVAETIAGEQGYADDEMHIDDTEVVHETISQARMTDAQLLRHLADREGFEFFVDFDGFHFHERRTGQKPIRKFTYYTDPEQGDVIGFSIEESAKAHKGKVTTKGRDPDKKETISESSDNETESNQDALCDFQLVASPETGQLKKVTAVRVGKPNENIATEETIASSEASKDAAKREASGRFKRSRMNNVKLTLNVVGDPEVVAKSTIEVAGIGKSFSGLYYVENVKHNVAPGGYTMQLQCKRTGRNAGIGGSVGGSTADTGGEKTAGKKNEQEAEGQGQGELVPETIFEADPVTGQLKRRIVYKKRGRDKKQ